MRSRLNILFQFVKQIHIIQFTILSVICLSLTVSAQYHIKDVKWPKENGQDGLHLSIYNSMSTDLMEALDPTIKSWERDSPLPPSLNLNVTVEPTLECTPKMNSVRVCDKNFGNTGWVGYEVSRSTISGSIKTSIVQINTYYLGTGHNLYTRYVLCHEIGHALGLRHQDEDFHNENLGSCMDYTTNWRDSTSPNVHDWQALLDTYGKLPSSFTTQSPSLYPTPGPSEMPSLSPTASPTNKPSSNPTVNPTLVPSKLPTLHPTQGPSEMPTLNPTAIPSENPTLNPTINPTEIPTLNSTAIPSEMPTLNPTMVPTDTHSLIPTLISTLVPSTTPTSHPTFNPSKNHSNMPSQSPSNMPSTIPTRNPSRNPTLNPTTSPTKKYSSIPSKSPTTKPSFYQTSSPSKELSRIPTQSHSAKPSINPSTNSPSNNPTHPTIKYNLHQDFSLNAFHWDENLSRPHNPSSVSVSGFNELTFCGCPEKTCNDIVLETLSGPGNHSCRKRIMYNIENRGLTPQQACVKIGSKYMECKACNPLTCGSNQKVVENPASTFIQNSNREDNNDSNHVHPGEKTRTGDAIRRNAEISMLSHSTSTGYAPSRSQNEERWLQLLRNTPNCQNHPLHGQELYNLEMDIGYKRNDWGNLVGLNCQNGILSYSSLEKNQEIQQTDVHLLWVPNYLSELIDI